MNDEKPRMDLATLALEDCRRMVGEVFTWNQVGLGTFSMELIDARPVRRDPAATKEGDRPFSLKFRGPPDPVFEQGMVDLEHPKFSLPGIFLVPTGTDEQGTLYEAVFS